MTLYEEVTQDPVALGYAAALAVSDQACVDILNLRSGAGSGNVDIPLLPRSSVLRSLIAISDQLSTGIGLNLVALTPALIKKWEYRLQLVAASNDSIELNSGFVGMMNQAVTDSLITTAKVNQLLKRTGSRAELLWGFGFIVTAHELRNRLNQGS